ncbi:hypothetical protein BZA05DRAFT_397995 [Tricharina praecox]|uniref:uncharacterized protein n=1 Tax=Tricharina praecox TaxID=43433 RepID=UPI002220D857|nr:uncharacterized protein BZA05DRAFT_397995 [Tricharina praecox]KAI5851841.1 hypothetical protein BZA05DRAFT_397995 [Tricharina praecox]
MPVRYRGLNRIRNSFKHNWRCLRRNPLGELAGSLGDLGTLLPILIALTAAKSISLPSTLVFSGIWNIISGTLFGIPLVVQPMKALAAVSLSRGLSLEETMAAGIGVGVIVLLLSVTGLLARVSELIPVPIIKGIQVGAGISLALNAGATLQGLELNSTLWYDNLFWAIGAFIILYGTCRWPRRCPFAILVFVVGGLFAGVQLAKSGDELPHIGYKSPFVKVSPTPEDFATGFGTAGLGQVPLTVLNSIIAVTYLSRDLLPDQPAPGVTALGLSVAVMNLVGCWFGAMPVCHGSGGLAGQYRFGARSGSSVQILGIFKIAVGLLFGSSLTGLLERFPKSFLGIMVFAAGMELVSVGENLNSTAPDIFHLDLDSEAAGLDKQTRKDRWMIMMVTVGIFVAFRNCFVGFMAGCLCWALLEVQNRMDARRDGESSSGETTPLLR